MNALQRKVLENLVEEAVEKVVDQQAWENWGPSARARASYAQALLANDAIYAMARAPREPKPSGVAQKEAPPPVEGAGAASDAGSTPAPAPRPVKRRKPRRKRG